MSSDSATIAIFVIGMLVLIFLLGPLATFIIWNWVMPSLGVSAIAFWQACGIY